MLVIKVTCAKQTLQQLFDLKDKEKKTAGDSPSTC